MRARFFWFFLGAVLAAVLLGLVYQLPPVKYRLEWRFDAFGGIVRGWLRPGDTLPAPELAGAITRQAPTRAPTHTLEPTQVVTSSADTPLAPTPTATPLPNQALLEAPVWEKQDWNNCGPATLALGLRYFGWEGDQFAISDLLKPDRGDKNVNIEELIYFVRTRAGWLNADFRVDGTPEQLKRLIAAGYPVIVEKGIVLDANDGGGGWAGHYLLLTGYDDERQIFVAQDTNPTTGGQDRELSYTELDEEWQAFNRVYLFIYPVEAQAQIDNLLGPHAELDFNRQQAIETARMELEQDPEDAYAWFNLGSNLIYFERYGEAAQAFDNALAIGLPWRFTRYQFGPYIAYFNQGRFDELIELADATLFRTYKAEESLLWRGWARYRMGEVNEAVADFREALEYNPNYLDAQYALDFLGVSP